MLRVLIQAHKKNRAFGGLSLVRQGLRSRTIIIENAGPNPPGADRTSEALNLRGLIASLQVMLHGIGIGFMGKTADLHSPAPAGIERDGRLQHFEFDLGNPRQIDVDCLRRRERKINDPAIDKRAAIGNADNSRVSGL